MYSSFYCKKNWTSELGIGPPNSTYSYPECVLEYIGHLAPKIFVGEICLQIFGVQLIDIPHL